MNRIYLALMVAALVAGVVFLSASIAYGQEAVSVDIPIGTLRGDPGDLILVATVETGPGLDCIGGVVPVNNMSNHDNSDVAFVSGNAGGMIFDVEVPTFDPNQKIAFVSEGPTLIYFRIGDDGVISAGFVAMLDCHEPPETTTTTTSPLPDETTTTTTEPPGPAPTTTTTEPAPVGGVPAGGGAMAAVSGQDPLILLAFGAVLLTVGVLMSLWVIVRKLWDLWANGRT